MRKSCKRKIRDPYASINARMGLVKSQATDLGLAYHSALNGLLSGHGNEQMWSTVTCAANVGLLLSEAGIVPEALPIIKLAQEALIAIKRQADASGEWRVNIAHHLKAALLSAINYHDEQNAKATKAQLMKALSEVRKRIENGDVML